MKPIIRFYWIYCPLVIVLLFISCKGSQSVQLLVPDSFQSQAVHLPVKGSKGSGFHQKISFGTYFSEDIKRGWGSTSSTFDRSSFFSLEQIVLQLFQMQKNEFTTKEKNKYNYSLHQGSLVSRIFAEEQTLTQSTKVRLPNLKEVNRANQQRYQFAAAIILEGFSKREDWFMQLFYDQKIEGGGIASFIKNGLPREKGFISYQKDTIVIHPVFLRKVVGNNGKITSMPFDVVGGYEFRIGDGVVGIVDAIKDAVWLYKDMSESTKMVIASAASALLLRREK
jgi:hypothetical protein